jgi:putative transposase
MTEPHKGWFSRGYLPHFDSSHIYQFVTLRLSNSLPSCVIERLKDERNFRDDSHRRKYLEMKLDECYGECFLKDSKVAKIVENSLLFFHEKRYSVTAWVIMPNHVHVLLEIYDGFPLSKIIQSWKGFTARKSNIILNRSGSFWQREYYDRFIRNEEHFNKAIQYIHMNPVKAQLVSSPEDWQFSSSRFYSISDTFPGSADFQIG